MKLLVALLLSVALPAVALARLPPPPDMPFTDRDPAARVYFGSLDTERGQARLARHLERKPGDSRGWSARAFWHSLQGNADAVLADLERARDASDGSSRRQRERLWSEGWIRLNLGQVPEAAAAWSKAVRLHGGRPYWVAYSFAVLAELGGERQTALAWYRRAASDMPARWGTRHGMLGATGHWQEGQRAAMIALYEAYADERDGTADASAASH